MSFKSFREFREAYQNGTIVEDATWRAYDIEDMVNPTRSGEGLRQLTNYQADYFGYAAFAAIYGIENAQRAQFLLGLWRTWQRIATGEVKQRLKLREYNL